MAKIQHKRSSVIANSQAKEPTSGQMEYGELAVNFNFQDPTIFIKDSGDDIVAFVPANDTDININAGTGLTASGSNPTTNQSTATTRVLAVDQTWLNTQITNEIFDSEININAGNGLTAGGNNATTNQTANTTRTLSVTAADNTISVTSNGISVAEGNLSIVPSATLATTANELTNSKTLWGQSFNGSSNVSGALSGVSGLTGTNAYTIGSSSGRITLAGAGGATVGETGSSTYFKSSANYRFYKEGSSSVSGRFNFGNLSTDRTYSFPNTGGTIALTSDIPASATIGNGTITVRQSGISDQTFSVNQSGNTLISLNDTDTVNVPGAGTITIVQPGLSDQTFGVNQTGNTTITLLNDNTTDNLNNGQINVNGSSSITASGTNATANQSANTTRTLSVNTSWLNTQITDTAYGKSSSDSRYLRLDSAAGAQTLLSTSTTTFSGAIVSSGDITAFSDARLKSNVLPITNAINKVCELNGVTFERTDLNSNIRRAGLIAQDVEAVLPEVVQDHENGYKTVAYGPLVGLLVEAIKELSAEVKQLKEGSY